MENVIEFIQDCGVFYLLTDHDGKAEGRPFNAIMAAFDNLYIATDRKKAVCSQLKNNPWVQIIAHKPGTRDWIRIDGSAEEQIDSAIKIRMFTACNTLSRLFDAPDHPDYVVFAVKNFVVDWHIESAASSEKTLIPMNKADVLAYLDHYNIRYEIMEHPPLNTIEDVLKADLPRPETVAKNIFLRDDKKRDYYLLTVRGDKRLSTKAFQHQYGTRHLSFADGDELMTYLGLKQGSVSPLGLLNDREHRVHFYLDEDFIEDIIGMHPNDNTATLWMATSSLTELLENFGCTVNLFIPPVIER